MMFLAGPALIGLISEYATYWYAINENVRPPVEGIPYLSASVTMASLILAVSVSMIFFLSRLVIGFFVGNVIASFEDYGRLPSRVLKLVKRFIIFDSNSLEKTIEQINKIPNKINKINKISPKNILIIAVIAWLVSFGIYFWQNYDREVEQAISGGVFLSTYFVIIILTLWRKFVMQAVAVIVAISFYAFSISLLFNHHYYSMFLNLTGFGGGQPITLQLKSHDKPVEMELILRSKNWFIGHSATNGQSIEVPQHVVKSVLYRESSQNAH